MTKKETDDYRLYLDERFKTLTTLINAHQINNDASFGEIKDHLKKLNGSVKEHSTQIEELRIRDAQHLTECPVLPKVERLEQEIIGTWLRKHWKLALIIFFVTLIITNAFVDFLGIKGLLGLLVK